MYQLKDIKSVHLEPTTKCQARCPMCPRRINGGMLNPLFEITSIDLETFKKWFSVPFLKQLDNLFMCGNLGDPIINQDCLEIFSYIRELNSNINLTMHTNGSAREENFWTKLAEIRVQVTFGIDGLEDTHKLYRIGTDYNKIIRNATSFIRAGGNAEWHMLVFKHNEHQIDTCRNLSEKIGFKKFVAKYTSRFKNNEFHVLDDFGRTTHILEPTERSKEITVKVEKSIQIEKPYINCKAQNHKEIYVSANGTISPCCWLDFSWHLHSDERRIDFMDRIGGLPSLSTHTLEEIFDSGFFNAVSNTWKDNPLKECSRQCGSFDKCGGQFK